VTYQGAGNTVSSFQVLEIQDLRKRYGETQALGGVDLTLRAREIVGIAGSNGAGKSTLVKILAAEVVPDSGEITLDGKSWSPIDQRNFVAVVHQEPFVWPDLTVGENLLVGHEGERYRYPRLPQAALEVMENVGIAHLADSPLGEVALAARQKTEIARALTQDARLFLFDEPNSALTDLESEELFRYMRVLADEGRAVVFITHRLAELVAVSDRAVVLRDGLVASILNGDAMTEEAIAKEMVGGEDGLDLIPSQKVAVGDRPGDFDTSVVSLRSWTHQLGAFEDISLEVGAGEVVAVVGVEGSGARELVASIAGMTGADGTIQIGGVSGYSCTRTETAYLPADRREALYPLLSVGENLVARLSVPEIATRRGLLKLEAIRRLGKEFVKRFLIKTSSVQAEIGSLSGGNQQKVAIAAAVALSPSLLVLIEPTRGVDVGAKVEIERILRAFGAEGKGVIMYCAEVQEAHQLADRVDVVVSGIIQGSARVSDFEAVAELAGWVARTQRGAEADLREGATAVKTNSSV